LEPSDGVIGLGRPVDIVLTQYPGVRIRLSLVTRGKNAALKVAPQIDVGQGETTDFSQRRLELARLSLRKDANKLDEQLSAARYEAAAIQNWLASPVVKPLQSRRERTTRLQVLKQMIPALEQRMSYAQTRADVLVRLSQLAEQIHDTASIHLVVSLQAEDRAP
jgi:hypothetical protein